MDPDQIIAGSYLAKATRNYSSWEPAEIRILDETQQRVSDIDERRSLVLEMEEYMANIDSHLVITEWAMLFPYVDNQIKNYNVASGFANHSNIEHLWFEP